jgi:6-phosphogluconolactonase
VRGADPCYVSLDPRGRWLLAANYSSGSLAVLPVEADGSPGETGTPCAARRQLDRDPERQDKAHAHFIRYDPSGSFVFAVDLGMDQVLVYRQDDQSGRLTANSLPALATAPGAGPRHLAYHPNGRYIYLSNELNSTVTACSWDAQAGVLREIQTLSTLKEDFQGENFPSDIHLTPSGDFLYAANRGENSLAAYRVDGGSGRLERLGNYPCGGDWPRNFAIDPDGKFLLVANQKSGSVAVLRIAADGALSETGHSVAAIEAAVCVLFS